MIADKHLKLIKLYSLNYPASCFRTLLAILETTDVQINPIKRAFKTWGWSLQSSPTQSPQYIMPDKITALFNGYANSVKGSYQEVYLKEEGSEDVYLGTNLLQIFLLQHSIFF